MGEDKPGKRPDFRYCNTHALVAVLFAASCKTARARDAWCYVAESWESLAELKRREAPVAAGNPLHKSRDNQ